jgi:hypothetical protein
MTRSVHSFPLVFPGRKGDEAAPTTVALVLLWSYLYHSFYLPPLEPLLVKKKEGGVTKQATHGPRHLVIYSSPPAHLPARFFLV